MGSISLNRQEKTNSSVVPAEHSPNPFFPAIPVLLRCIDAQGEAILNCCKEIDFRIGVEPALPCISKKTPCKWANCSERTERSGMGASSSSTRTGTDPAFDFGNRSDKNGNEIPL
jgi:hypothetical protein